MKKKAVVLLVVALCAACLFCGCQPKQHVHQWQMVPTSFDGGVCLNTQYVCADCNETKTSTVKNVVLIVGDGMGPQHIEAGQMVAQTTFGFTQWQHSKVDTTNMLGEITDSAAAGTAMATGVLTENHRIGQDASGNELTTIMDIASQKGMKTGFVTTDYIYGATPAAFSGHIADRDSNFIALFESQLQSDLNLMCASYNTTAAVRGDLINPSKFTLCDKYANREQIAGEDHALCLFDLEGYGRSVTLAEATDFALNFLSCDSGFVLLVEQAHIDKYSHDYSIRYAVNSVISLQNTVQAVQDWIGDRLDTAVIITADHETCGLQVSAQDDLPKNYTFANSGVKLFYDWTADYHTAQDVDIFCNGFHVDFSAISTFGSGERIKNSDIFRLMQLVVQQL